jgi:putative transposase
VAFYRRNLPHWHPIGKALFITWRPHATIHHKHYLARPEIAQVVTDSLWFTEQELRHYDLAAWILMSNHVHILIHPLIEPAVCVKRLKGFTARQCNSLLNRSGAPFWQRGFFDHWLRSDIELQETIAYIEANPVRAGLVRNPGDYHWSSASSLGRSGLQAGRDHGA